MVCKWYCCKDINASAPSSQRCSRAFELYGKLLLPHKYIDTQYTQYTQKDKMAYKPKTIIIIYYFQNTLFYYFQNTLFYYLKKNAISPYFPKLSTMYLVFLMHPIYKLPLQVRVKFLFRTRITTSIRWSHFQY